MPTHVSALAIGHSLHEYRIERLLGHGGFGLTYLAQDTNLNALVAIKEFLPQEFAVRAANASVIPKSDSDTEPYRWGLERFKEEARALARFKHPHIVRAARLIEANGTAYMVMEFEPGMTLSQYFKRVSPMLDEAQILGLFMPVLDGLEALHSMELIHRDIKPGNIYLRVRGGPMLIDFGAVRHAIGVHSRSLTAVVTPGYAPIEQYSSDGRQGPWSDMYATGATIYSCLFGHPPVDAAQRSAAISDGGDDPQPSALKLGAGRFSAELLEAVDWALKFRVRDRPQTAEEFRARLAAVPTRPQPLTVPKDVEDEAAVHLGTASGSGQQPLSTPAPTPTPAAPDSALMLRAHSRPPAENDPDKTDVGAVAKAIDAQRSGSAPASAALDLEFPTSAAQSAVPMEATEVIPKSPILERMGSGIRRAQTQKPAAATPEAVPATRSSRSTHAVPLRSTPAPEPPRRRIPYVPIALALIVVLATGAGIYFYQKQSAYEEEHYRWAAGANTAAAYQQYLQLCHLCPHHAEAQQAIDALENADKFVRLRTEFQLLLLNKTLGPPTQPNASDDLREMQLLEPTNPYLPQARSALAEAVAKAAPKPRVQAAAVAPKPAAAPIAAAPPVPAQTANPQVTKPVVAQKKPAPLPVPAVSPKPAPQNPAPAAAAPVEAQAAKPAPQPAAPVVQEPQPLSTPAPSYPREALLSGQQGWVDVQFTVNTDGSVSDVTVVQAEPVMVFNKAATRAVSNWRFSPYTVNGVAQAKRIQMRVSFKP